MRTTELVTTAIAPEAVAAKEATRFFGGIVEGLGKPAYSSVTVKVGRRTVYRERHAFGVTHVLDKRGPVPVRTEKLEVARWETIPLFIAGAVAVGLALAESESGSSRLSSIKNSSTYAKVRHPLSGIENKLAGSPEKNALGITFTNYLPGGGANPLNYIL
jgi:hypothetical protein